MARRASSWIATGPCAKRRSSSIKGAYTTRNVKTEFGEGRCIFLDDAKVVTQESDDLGGTFCGECANLRLP